MKRFDLLFLVIFFWPICFLHGQSFIDPGDELVNGYSRKISGTDFDYHSCIPGLRQSILIRAESGKDFMEWETDAPLMLDDAFHHIRRGGTIHMHAAGRIPPVIPEQ